MSKYIDADKLIAEIEKMREEYNNCIPVKVSIRKLETKDFIRMGIVEVLNKVLLCAYDSIIQQEQPSLPSNLDEAAKEYMRNYIPFDQCDSRDIVRTFKAGAEWMAGQFQKIEGELVDWYSTSDGKDYCCGIKTQDNFEVPEGFYIRKKKSNEQR